MKALAEERKTEFKSGLPVQAEILRIRHEKAHFHPDIIELLVCLQGEITIKSCNEEKILHEGDTCALDFSDIHCLFSDKNNLVLSVHINGRESGDIYEELKQCFLEFDTTKLNELQKKPSYGVQDLLLSISAILFREPGPDTEARAVRAMSEQMLRLLTKYFDWLSFIPDPYYSNRHFHERCRRIMAYCLENYNKKITISQVAEMEHINETYVSSFMKKSSLGGFKATISFIRSFYAEHMLLTTDMDVISISESCGFSDPKYFYTAFRKAWGCTPARHRQWYREYLKTPVDVEIIDPAQAKEMLDSYITSYHLRKTVSLVL